MMKMNKPSVANGDGKERDVVWFLTIIWKEGIQDTEMKCSVDHEMKLPSLTNMI